MESTRWESANLEIRMIGNLARLEILHSWKSTTICRNVLLSYEYLSSHHNVESHTHGIPRC